MKSFTYDKANQLVTSTVDDKVTNYAYDAAGRLVKEGSVASGFKTYSYGYLDKILAVQENGQQIAAFDYHINGQIAQATHGDKTENFLWDGLSLIHRGDNSYINEPYVTGGNPILSSKDGVMFNDMLGTTLGIKNEQGFEAINMTAFGEPTTSQPNNSTTEIDKVGFFTGKPYIGELGYAFLFRNYRADQGKWQTKDTIGLLGNLPGHDHSQNSLQNRLGYPDGWNNLAYCKNRTSSAIDYSGFWTVQIGLTPTGGGGVGGTVGVGIAFGYSSEFGFTAGFYETTGGGSSVGASGSVSGTLTVSGAGSIAALAGTAMSVGGSFGEGLIIGGEANIPINIPNMGNTSFDFSIGFGGGTPAEQHTFITQTFIQQVIGNSGTLTSIKE